MHILLVDDEPANIMLMKNILGEENYAFYTAENGLEALDQIEQNGHNVDLILLDISMPKADGFSVCKSVKQHKTHSQIPIIFLTGQADIETIRKGFVLGAVDYIVKPFNSTELLARVRTHVDLYHAKALLQQNNIDLATNAKRERIQLLSELEENQAEIIWMLTELMESTSDETGQHIRRVAEVSALLAKLHPELDDDDVRLLRHASPMHDIGKMTVPHDILHKPASYTEEEFQAMKLHTTNAYNLLKWSERPLLKAAATIAHEHHEKWNGKGYPRGLEGKEIHLYGRIVALADVFDALTHKRKYKQAWDLESAIEYITDHKGSQFDPELIVLFLENLDEFVAINALA